MFKVFISHSSADKPFVRQLTTDLARFGIDSWLDENEIRIGDSIRRSIEAGLGDSDYFLLVISNSSILRPWVAVEIDTALSLEFSLKRRFILPLRIDKAPIPVLLSGRLYADFYQDYDSALQKLVTSIHDTPASIPGLIESIKAHHLLEIRTSKGDLVSYTKTQIIKCTRGIVDSYIEQVSTTGELTNVKFFPSGPTKRWEEGGREFIEHRFPSMKAGEQLSREFKAVIRNMFIDLENYWETRHDNPCREDIIDIIFPKKRPPISWESLEKRGSQTILKPWCQRLTTGGKPLLRLKVLNPRQYSTSVLRWQW